jgi:hypothetical protein
VPHPHAEDAELAALEAEAEKAGAAGGDQPQAEGETIQPEQPQVAGAVPAAEPAKQPGPMIPKERFDEAVLRERSQAAYWKGKHDALAETATRGKGAEQVTPEQEIAALEEAVLKKAGDFDSGQITMAEYKRFENQVNQRVATLRQQPVQPQRPTDDMRLVELTEALPERFPVLNDARLTSEHIARLEPLARAEMEFEGVQLDGSPRSAFLVRERLAKLAQDRYGGGQPAAQPATPATDPTKAVRGKMALADRMPPNLNKSGTAAVPQDRHSLKAVAEMDLDDIATAIPESTLRALTGQ